MNVKVLCASCNQPMRVEIIREPVFTRDHGLYFRPTHPQACTNCGSEIVRINVTLWGVDENFPIPDLAQLPKPIGQLEISPSAVIHGSVVLGSVSIEQTAGGHIVNGDKRG